MRAIQVEQTGGPEQLQLREVATPAPGAGEVRVRLESIGVNFIDVYHRQGVYKLPLPFTPGMEGCGRVSAVGGGVAQRVGERVAWAMTPGSYAEEALVAAWRAVPVPDALSPDQACASMLQGMTAHFLVNDAFALRPGQVALVHAAAGGVGLLLTQLAAQKGARVIATTSSDAKAALARQAGAAEVIRYDREDIVERVRALTGGAGVHVAYDSVGKATFEQSLASLRSRGLLVLYGAASGQVPPFDLARLGGLASVYVTRPSLGAYIATPEENLARAQAVLKEVAEGRLHLRIEHRYPLAEAAQAHRDLEARATTGKLLLMP